MDESGAAWSTVSSAKRRPSPPAYEEGWLEYLRRAAEGDQAGLTSLYDASSQLVFTVALRILDDRADAEEVALDVFSQVWRKAGDFDRDRGSLTSWLITLTRSRAIDRVRSRKETKRREEGGADLSAFATASASPEEDILAGQNRMRVRAAVAILPPEQREAIELAYFSGLSHSELASRLGQPLGTVKTRIRLGMMKLRSVLESPSSEEGMVRS